MSAKATQTPDEMNGATTETVTLMIYFQLSAAAISVMVAFPLIIRHLYKGRYKLGVGLRSEKRPGGVAVDRTVDRSPRNPIGRQTNATSIFFGNFNNNVFLRTLPLIGISGACFFFYLVHQVIAIGPMVYKNPDPLSNFRRAGWVAAVLLPLIFLLGIKNTLFAFVGKSYERVNFLHRLLGPGVIMGGGVHVGMYIKEITGKHQPFEVKGHVLSGIITLSGFLFLGLTAVPFFRYRFYNAFKIFHTIGMGVGLTALYYHVPNFKPFIYLIALIMNLDGITGGIKTSMKKAVFTALLGGMTKIEIEGLGSGWRAGQHVYLRVFKGHLTVQKHPFTIAKAPASVSVSGKDSLVLMVKSRGTFTQALHAMGDPALALEGNDLEKDFSNDNSKMAGYNPTIKGGTFKVAVDGPYGSSFVDMTDYETVVLFAGGSGFSYAMATFDHIVGSASQDEGVTKTVFIIWSLRDLDMIHAFAEPLNAILARAQDHQMQVIMRVHKTEPTGYNFSNPVPYAKILAGRAEPYVVLGEAFKATFQSLDERGEIRGCGIGVGVCGPEGLVKAARSAVVSSTSRETYKAGGIKFHSESFRM